MLYDLGYFALLISFLLALYAAAAAVFGAQSQRPAFVESARNAALAVFPLMTLSVLAVVYGLVTLDFSQAYVADVSSRAMSTFLRIMGTSLTVIFSLGAIIGAMITMYSAVANRISEIGTLRALGFHRSSILTAFLAESLITGLIGGTAGLVLASFLQFFTISTLNFQTFSELAFSFELSFWTALKSISVALIMGLAGGLLPALKASRMKIVDALRSV